MSDHELTRVIIAQVSDLHVVAAGRTPETDPDMFVDNNANARRAVSTLRAEAAPPAVVLATGDLAADGHDAEYSELVEILGELDQLVLALPGNHDRREPIRASFPDLGWADADHASWVHDVDGVRIVGLDSTRPGSPGAEFDEERAAWLDAALAAPHSGPTMLALHHPPIRTGITWMDGGGFVGLDQFTEIVDAHGAAGRLDRIVCGHMHRSIVGACGRVPVQVAPTTIQAVALSLEQPSAVELSFDPIGYLMHVAEFDALSVGGVSSIVTHTRWVGDFPTLRPNWAHYYE